MDIHKDSYLRIVSWNCRNLASKYVTLQNKIIAHQQPHIILIQEAGCQTGFHGYSSYFDPNTVSPHTLTLVRNDLSATLLHAEDCLTVVEASLPWKSDAANFTLVNFYQEHATSSVINNQAIHIFNILDKIPNFYTNNVVFGSDLNIQPDMSLSIDDLAVQNHQWCSTFDDLVLYCPADWKHITTRTQTRTVKTKPQDDQKELSSSPEPTLQHTESTIDYIFFRLNSLLQPSLSRLPEQYGSDHYPLMLSIPLNAFATEEERQSRPTFNFNKFYRTRPQIITKLNSALNKNPPSSPSELLRTINKVTKPFRLRRRKRTHTIAINTDSDQIANLRTHISELNKKINKNSSTIMHRKLRRKLLSARSKLKRLSKKTATAKKNRPSANKASHNSKDFERYLASFKGKKTSTHEPTLLLDKHKNPVVGMTAISDHLSTHIQTMGNHTPHPNISVTYSDFHQMIDAWSLESIEELPEEHKIEQILSAPISTKELKNILKNPPRFKTPGDDFIPYELLWDAFSADPLNFTQLINQTWASASLPAETCHSIFVLLHKKGPSTDINNYRPLAMLSTYWKLIFNIANKRLTHYCNEFNIIIPQQHGFRRKHECLQQITNLLEPCFYRKICNQQTWIACLDFRKAYDSVWLNGLWWKLGKLGIGSHLLRLLRNAYATQRACVRTNISYTDMFPVERGVRQGCIISPLLFSLYINDILKDAPWKGIKTDTGPTIKGLLYADDVVLAASSLTDLKLALSHIEHWCAKWQMTLHPDKCSFMKIDASTWADALLDIHPSRPRTQIQRDTLTHLISRPTLWGKPISYVSSMRYLGYHISHDLSQQAHGEFLETKWNIGLSKIQRALADPNVLIQAKKRLIFDCLLSPILWSAPLWSHDSALTHLFVMKLRKILRSCIQGPPGTPTIPLAAEFGILPLDLLSQRHTLLFLHRMRNSPNSLSQQTISDAPTFSTNKSLISRMRDSCSQLTPHFYDKNMPHKDLKKFIRDMSNAILSDQLEKRARHPTTNDTHHRCYFAIRRYLSPQNLINFSSIPKPLRQNMVRTSLPRRHTHFHPLPLDQHTLIRARLGIPRSTEYKRTHGHLLDINHEIEWKSKCAACMADTTGDLKHILLDCRINHRHRTTHKLFPTPDPDVNPSERYLTLLSDHFLSKPHNDLHIAPVHQVAKAIQIAEKRTVITLAPHCKPNSAYKRHQHKVLAGDAYAA